MRRVIVSPDQVRRTHHISLSDGQKTLGFIAVNSRGDADPFSITRAPVNRTALKTTSGSQTYSDFEPPWSPVAQEDWSGGCGILDFDDNITRFWDSNRVNTTFAKKMFLGPQETYTAGLRNQVNNLPGNVTWLALKPGNRQHLAALFTANANFDAANLYVFVRRVGAPAADLTVELCSSSGGEPDTVLQTATVTTTIVDDTDARFYKAAISAQSLNSGTLYWVKVYSADGTDQDHWEVGVKNASGASKESSDGTVWSASGVDLYYRVTDADSTKYPILFRYLYGQYLILNGDSGAPSLYINGDRGVADANTGALTTLIDATKSWTNDEWVGAVVYIFKGKGADERQPWRTITGNNGTTLTVDNAWKIEHNTTSEYVIINSNKWTAIASGTHQLTAPVTDICIVNNYCYLCQGDDVNIKRWRAYNNSGTFTNEFVDDSTNKAVFLEATRESDSVLYLWRANNKDANGDISVSRAASPTSWANLSFGTAIPLRDQLGKITQLQEYDQKCWVMREGSVFAAAGTKVDEINLREIHTLMESTNGAAVTVQNVYLFFNLGAGIERYYSSSMDDVGPNRDDGLPTEKQGVVSSLLAYPGRYMAAIDGGSNGYSSVMMHNGTGWHNIYVAPAAGLRILSIDFQPVHSTIPDRLWVCVGSDVIWLPFPSLTLDPTKDSNYKFTHYGNFTSGWIYVGMVDAFKFFKSLKLFAENLSDDGQIVKAEYQIDDETTWIPLEADFDTSPVHEINLKEKFGVEGKRLRFRLHLFTNDNSKTPLIKTTVVENISQVAVKYSYGFMYRVADKDMNLVGEPTEVSAEDFQNTIDEWAANLTPLVQRAWRKRFDNKTVFIDPTQSSPIRENSEGYIEKLTTVEI